MRRIGRNLSGLLVLSASLFGQTLVDLRTQGKSVDFSTLPSTRPVKTGTTLPASCAVGELFFKSNATAGQNLYACHTQNSWSVISATAQTSRLMDLAAVRVSATELLIGGSCMADTPCNVRVGNVTHSFVNSAQVTLLGGSGKAFIYISGAGVLTVGHNVTLNCNSACVATSGVTDFPIDSIPLATWTATVGAWDGIGYLDFRAFQSIKNIVPGTGLLTVESSGTTMVEVDRALVGVRVTAPSTPGSACVSGSWAADSDYLYVCYGTNQWKRSALASW